MSRILVIDDHPLVRHGIVQVLSEAFPNGVVGEASSPSEALDEIWRGHWNLVLLDLSLPGRSGLELLKDIKSSHPRVPVLILSTYPESQFATRVLRSGAAGYLTKETPPELLVTAVRQVLAGHRYISPTVAQQLASEMCVDPLKPAHEALSDREYDVMLRIAKGNAVGEIAKTLCLSVKTISTYRSRILEKMGMRSNAELTQYAIRNHLVD